MALDPGMLDSVANANLKNVAEAPAFYSGLAMGNAVAHQQAMQQIQIAATGSIVKYLTESDPNEAVSVLKTVSGNDLGGALASILASLAAGQAAVKAGQTTPPVTP